MSFKKNSNCELFVLLLKNTNYIAKNVVMYFLFITLILIFVDIYTNILKIKFYNRKSICSSCFFNNSKDKIKQW
jgi:hypothetical protein